MAGWRRAELKSGVYDEIVSARLDRQLAALGASFEVHRKEQPAQPVQLAGPGSGRSHSRVPGSAWRRATRIDVRRRQ